MLIRDRLRLTEQALDSIFNHTVPGQYTLTIVDDGSQSAKIRSIAGNEHTAVVRFSPSVSVLGFLRNVGAQISERVFGRGDWLCFLDNDVAVFEGWLGNMIEIASWPGSHLLGGQRHPYHKPNQRLVYGRCVEETDAVAGYSMFMSWSTWDRFGPFDANAKGIGQSEDWAFSQRVKNGGGIVGYIHPPVLSHTGLTNSDGKPATGHEAFKRFPGLIYE
jgi:glycosyltransferase involved in cell wall biosynthesis